MRNSDFSEFFLVVCSSRKFFCQSDDCDM